MFSCWIDPASSLKVWILIPLALDLKDIGAFPMTFARSGSSEMPSVDD